MEGGSVSVMIAHLAASLELSDVTRVFILLSASLRHGVPSRQWHSAYARAAAELATQCPNQSRSHSVAQTATSKSGSVLCDAVFQPRNVKICDFGTSCTLSSYKQLHRNNPPHPSRKPPQTSTAAPLAGRRRRSLRSETLSLISGGRVFVWHSRVGARVPTLNKPYGDEQAA